jgi:hypothetical protein
MLDGALKNVQKCFNLFMEVFWNFLFLCQRLLKQS